MAKNTTGTQDWLKLTITVKSVKGEEQNTCFSRWDNKDYYKDNIQI